MDKQLFLTKKLAPPTVTRGERRERGLRFYLDHGVTVMFNDFHGKYLCLTCKVNECEHVVAAREYHDAHPELERPELAPAQEAL